MNLNSDKKRFWLDSLESLNDGKICDSMPIPIDLVGEIISKEDMEWYEVPIVIADESHKALIE